jgi:hypothetical protein
MKKTSSKNSKILWEVMRLILLMLLLLGIASFSSVFANGDYDQPLDPNPYPINADNPDSVDCQPGCGPCEADGNRGRGVDDYDYGNDSPDSNYDDISGSSDVLF